MKKAQLLKCIAIGLSAAIVIGSILYATGVVGGTKVQGAVAKRGALEPTVFGIATVQAKGSYMVGPTATGRIAKLYVDQGDRVKAGQIIGEMDPLDLEQGIAASSAGVNASRHNLEHAQAAVVDARSRNQLAQETWSRYAQLFENGAISKETLDAKRNDAQVAEAAVSAALSNYESARCGIDQSSAEYQGKLEQKKNLLLISPTDGVVVSRLAEAGSTVVGGQAVFNIMNDKEIWLKTRIDQARTAGIIEGQAATVILRSQPHQKYQGKVVRLDVQGDTVTEEKFVNVQLENGATRMGLGDAADVTIALPKAENAIYVPAAAVKNENGASHIWLVQNGRVVRREIVTGVQTRDGVVEIASGLTEGETVVVHSKSILTDGAKVRLVKEL